MSPTYLRAVGRYCLRALFWRRGQDPCLVEAFGYRIAAGMRNQTADAPLDRAASLPLVDDLRDRVITFPQSPHSPAHITLI